MAAVHFTTIPCDPCTVHKVQVKSYFCNICSSDYDIVQVSFKGSIAFLYIFMSEKFKLNFRTLRIMGKCSSNHLFPTELYLYFSYLLIFL